MVSLSTWLRYVAARVEYSVAVAYWKHSNGGRINRKGISRKEFRNTALKSLFEGKLTYLYRHKGQEMEPTIAGHGGVLLVRHLCTSFLDKTNPLPVSVGDVVLLKDPEKNEYLVRRLAATEGYEMVSKDEKDAPFVLEKYQCWVISDNTSFKPKEARDSRLFGPVRVSSLLGRVIYSMRSAVDHGPVQNSDWAMNKDSSVLAVELDVDEMVKNIKT